jgi:hypothetical protein
MHPRDVADLFGGQTSLAKLLGKRQSLVGNWVNAGVIPIKWHKTILEFAAAGGLPLSSADLDQQEVQPATNNPNQINRLSVLVPYQPASSRSPQQTKLDLGIQTQIEIDGIWMGVLSDGTPFLTGRGLARLCGLHHSVIQDLAGEWTEVVAPPRVTKIRDILTSHGDSVDSPFIPVPQRSGVQQAFPDTVCIAVLEYYSFDAGSNIKPEAQKNYRLLAGKALREFIYTQTGYDPKNQLPGSWKQFHDRVSATYNAIPAGYFGIFKEIADMIVTLGQAGLHIDSSFVPDISVGQAWAKHWASINGDVLYSSRVRFQHSYPSYFPQAVSNPQDAWCYPELALGEFRRWFRETYIGQGKFKSYLEGKVREKSLPVSFAQLAISAYTN